MNIYEKLAKVQKELKAPKDQRNNFGNYNYRSCEGILEAVKPLLAANDLALTLTDEMVQVGDRIYVKSTATVFPVGDSDGEVCVSVDAFAREEESKKGMDASQVTGAASSYARKYALNGLFCIDDNKDSDATNTHGKNEEVTKQAEAQRATKKASSDDIFCVDCRKTITEFPKKDGTIMTPKEMITMSMKDFGKPLCPDCYKKALGK